MARLIPSSGLLITFESAARLRSFSKAADELCLTESAISKQISKLESYLGLKLFDRVHGGIVPTEAAQGYAADVRQLLNRIETDTKSFIDRHRDPKELQIAVLTTFSNKWLLPRLKKFSASRHDVVVNINGRIDPFPFYESNFDAAVHFEDPIWQDVRKIKLFGEELVVAVSPDHFDPKEWLRNPQSIPLLSKPSRPHIWSKWFAIAGLSHPAPHSGPHYDTFATMIEAAKSGIGIALVPRIYIERELETGELVQPSPHVLKDAKSYILVLPDRDRFSPALQAFVDWIQEEARAFLDGSSAGAAVAAGE